MDDREVFTEHILKQNAFETANSLVIRAFEAAEKAGHDKEDVVETFYRSYLDLPDQIQKSTGLTLGELIVHPAFHGVIGSSLGTPGSSDWMTFMETLEQPNWVDDEIIRISSKLLELAIR